VTETDLKELEKRCMVYGFEGAECVAQEVWHA